METPIGTCERDADPAVEFAENGFLVIPDALSGEQVCALNLAFDRYSVDFPEEWAHFSDSFIQTVNVLPRVSDFDVTIEHPRILGLLRQLLGDELTLEEFSMMIRNPAGQTSELKGWHRDITRSYERRMEIQAISVVYYLTDVTATDHCFSIVPGTHGRLVDLRPEDVEPGAEVDVVGPAGTALVFHARCIHAGKLKAGSRQRRTLHVYYGRRGQARTSEWSEIPARLHEKHDLGLPPFLYSQWNVTDIYDGTGRKPQGADPSLSTTELLMEVQRRANRR